MIYKELGNTGQKISAIGQGTAGMRHGDKNRYIQALQLGIENGMTLIDTAEGYGDGRAEEIVGEAIKGQREKVVIASKVSSENLAYDAVIKACEGSLRRLGTETIDLYQIHWPNLRVPLSETLAAMTSLLRKGKIRHFGLSNFSKKKCEDVRAIFDGTISSLQIEYNFFERSAELEIFPYCEKMKISTLAFSPLNCGSEINERDKLDCLTRMANKYSKGKAQIILNWLVSKPTVIPIPKAATADHVLQNASAADFQLSAEDHAEIDRIFSMEIIEVPVDRIRLAPEADGERKIYQTLEEAKQNKYGFTPSPLELSDEIIKGDFLKPVRVIKSKSPDQRYDYDLIDGRIRYWAWAIAFQGKKPIPTICL